MKDKLSLRIVFMGTPEFAANCLEELVGSHHKVVGVVTVPDRPAGRGRKLRACAVKQTAEKHHLPLLQPQKLRDSEFLDQLAAWRADVFVVVAFRMLPEVVWSMPERGTFNLHASLLPDYRGAAPIQHALWNGDKITGVTTFFINAAIDEGEILLQQEVPITKEDDAGSLHDKLQVEGARLILRTLEGIADGSLKSGPQQLQGHHRPAPKIFTEHTFLRPSEQEAAAVHRQVRALSPYPGARVSVRTNEGDSKIWKVLKCSVSDDIQLNTAQLVIQAHRLFLGCLSGTIEIHFLQAEGKRAMTAAEFVNGLQDTADFELIAN